MSTQRTSACLLFVAILAAGCGGGSGSGAQGSCSLGSSIGCGGNPAPDITKPDPLTPADPSGKAGTVSLVASSNELGSAGLPGAELTVTALVRTADNVAVSGAAVQFAADSGFLAVTGATTDASGKAIAKLGTGGSKMNRPIKVTAKVGSQSASLVVNVAGTRFTYAPASHVTAGGSTTALATLLDSAGQPIAGEAVTATARNGNGVTVGAAATDGNGQVPVRFSATTRGSEDITLTALGASLTKSIIVGGSDVSLTPAVALDASGNEVPREVAVGTCFAVEGTSTAAGGSATLSASRGILYRDAGCSQSLAGPVALAGSAIPRTYIKSDNAGMSTIDAVLSGGVHGSTRVEFVAPLGSSARVNLQADLAVVGSGERSTLIAVVRDGTAANNLVKGATVQFSIVADPSGGNLLSPFVVTTGSDGVARAVFVAGPADGGKDGTRIQARIAELPGAAATTALTVNKKALSIQFGTGNRVVEHSSAVFQKDYAVLVSDSAGNPVKDAAISVAVWPTHYRKGYFVWVPPDLKTLEPGYWRQVLTVTCANEDTNRKGLYEASFDKNGNGLLDPGIPLAASASGNTDATGLATVSLRYPRDRALWVLAELTVSGTVAGTESLARNGVGLDGLWSDYITFGVSPPGLVSPYGQSYSCHDNH